MANGPRDDSRGPDIPLSIAELDDRIAEREAELERLTKQRDALTRR
jgi:uncharacterized small protein (DUF1192 family)